MVIAAMKLKDTYSWKESYDQPRQRHYFVNKGPSSQGYGFSSGHIWMGCPGGPEVKVSASNVGDPGSIPGSGRSPGERNGNPLQYSCLENPMDRGAWRATVHEVAKSQT